MTQQPIPSTEGAFDTEFQRLHQSFKAIAAIPNPVERRFRLNKIAPYHDIPKAEFRALFRLWHIEQSQGKGEQQ